MAPLRLLLQLARRGGEFTSPVLNLESAISNPRSLAPVFSSLVTGLQLLPYPLHLTECFSPKKGPRVRPARTAAPPSVLGKLKDMV